jgi:hypothetical protein
MLQRHTAAGRLTLDEFSDRVAAAYTARTLGELATVTGDLPAEPPEPAFTTPAGPVRRDLLQAFAVAVLSLVLLAVYMAVTGR